MTEAVLLRVHRRNGRIAFKVNPVQLREGHLARGFGEGIGMPQTQPMQPLVQWPNWQRADFYLSRPPESLGTKRLQANLP